MRFLKRERLQLGVKPGGEIISLGHRREIAEETETVDVYWCDVDILPESKLQNLLQFELACGELALRIGEVIPVLLALGLDLGIIDTRELTALHEQARTFGLGGTELQRIAVDPDRLGRIENVQIGSEDLGLDIAHDICHRQIIDLALRLIEADRIRAHPAVIDTPSRIQIEIAAKRILLPLPPGSIRERMGGTEIERRLPLPLSRLNILLRRLHIKQRLQQPGVMLASILHTLPIAPNRPRLPERPRRRHQSHHPRNPTAPRKTNTPVPPGKTI